MNMKITGCAVFGAQDEASQQTLEFTVGETEKNVVNLYPEIRGQRFDGFGGAITEAAAYVYSQMSETQKKELLTACFSAERMNYQFVRIPIDSCDFSLEQYDSYTESGAPDFTRMERWILPMLRDAEKAAGRRLPIMLSPWSPPAFMKTNGKREQGGRLKPEYYAAYADYLCRWALQMRELGFAVECMSLQNEPKAVQTWDSCIFTAGEEKRFLRDYFRPAQEKYGLTDIQIYLWDHNKERVFEWMRDILDESTAPLVAGACFHWYSGDHFEALDFCHRLFPDKKLMLSESCIEFRFYDKADEVGAAQMLCHEILGDLNHGISAFCDWNLLLDETGGPNYVGNLCMAPFHYDRRNGTLRAGLLQRRYETISRAVMPGSVLIGTTRFADSLDASAWQRPDGKIALLLLNRKDQLQDVTVRIHDREATLPLPAFVLEAFLIELF